jgi:hypothetical protein
LLPACLRCREAKIVEIAPELAYFELPAPFRNQFRHIFRPITRIFCVIFLAEPGWPWYKLDVALWLNDHIGGHGLERVNQVHIIPGGDAGGFVEIRKFYGLVSIIGALVCVAGFALPAQAQVGTQAFADLGSPSTNTGNINTGIMFAIGNLLSTSGQTGVFVGMPTQVFGPVSFTDTVPTSLDFGNTAFGNFSSSTITEFANDPGSVSFYVEGSYTPGSYVGGGPGPDPASVTISFTQDPPGSGAISDSATFSIPPTGLPSVPEPASLSLFAVALPLLAARRRRKA